MVRHLNGMKVLTARKRHKHSGHHLNRFENLEALVAELKKEGVTITDTLETYDYGKFIHIMDIEGNKIELWEANDVEYEKLGIQMGSKTTK